MRCSTVDNLLGNIIDMKAVAYSVHGFYMDKVRLTDNWCWWRVIADS